MNSRERVLMALNHQEPDRVPIDIGGTLATSMHVMSQEKLLNYLGHKVVDQPSFISFYGQAVVPDKRIVERFQGDCIALMPNPSSTWQLKVDGGTYFDEMQVGRKLDSEGKYYDLFSHPFAEATLEDIEKFNWPDPHDPARFEGMKERAKDLYENTPYAVILHGPRLGVLQDSAWAVGFTRWLMALIIEEEFARAIINKFVDFHLAYWEKALKLVGKHVQVVQLCDDLGMQDNPFISPKLYRKLIKPAHKQIIDCIKSTSDAKVFLHSCGSVVDLIPDFIETGVDILNPIQLSARGMDAKKLKEEFGDRLTFWGGGCNTQTTLPKGTPLQVSEQVKLQIEQLSSGGGFIFAPDHTIQPDVPTENIVALYDTAIKYGEYGRN